MIHQNFQKLSLVCYIQKGKEKRRNNQKKKLKRTIVLV